MPAFILMGVSGSGKSTVGKCVAQAMHLPFIEGDDYHPPENVAKMTSGIPLSDTDRVAWIDALMQAANARHENDLIIACSALTQYVRARIQAQSRRSVVFVHLTADPTILENRLRTREPHFMKEGLLPSQLAALQLSTDAILIDNAHPLVEVCSAVQARIEKLMSAT